VVEPMMVGIIGGGMAHIRLADGSHRFIDGQSTVPLAVRPDSYRSKPGSAHDVFDTVDNENLNGPKAVAVPGSLKAWCESLHRFGTMSLADVMQPAIRHASRGFLATPYLHECIVDSARAMLKDKAISAIYLPDGKPLDAGDRVVRSGGYMVQLLPDVGTGPLAIMTERLEDFRTLDEVLTRDEFSAPWLTAELLWGMPFEHTGESAVRYACWCDRVRVISAIASLDPVEIRELAASGQPLEITCDYCGTVYSIPGLELRGLLTPS
jgi:hypothetical protein